LDKTDSEGIIDHSYTNAQTTPQTTTTSKVGSRN